MFPYIPIQGQTNQESTNSMGTDNESWLSELGGQEPNGGLRTERLVVLLKQEEMEALKARSEELNKPVSQIVRIALESRGLFEKPKNGG